jgi:cold shock CspA family protein
MSPIYKSRICPRCQGSGRLRYKGKLINWNVDKAFGFIQPNAGGADIFIHKSALFNRKRTPQINDIITFSMTKGKDGRRCASDATFSGES